MLPARQRFLSVRRAATYGRLESPPGHARKDSRSACSPRSANGSPDRSSGPAPPPTWTIGLRIMAAGLGRTLSPTSFLAIKGFCALGGLLLPGSLSGSGRGAFGLLMGAMLAWCCLRPPTDYWADHEGARGRKGAVRPALTLPDALDLLAVSVEAGMGFDASLAKMNEHMDGPLAEEFGLTLSEMRIGESRPEALKRRRARGRAGALGLHPRHHPGRPARHLPRPDPARAGGRRAAAQPGGRRGAGMKAPIKMLFPTVLFIFPAMFLVILGPAILNVQKLFG